MKWVGCGRSPTYPLHSIAIHPCPSQRPVASSRAPRWPGQKQEAGKDGNWPASARPKACGFLPASRSIAAHRTFKQGSSDFQSSSISFSNDLQTAVRKVSTRTAKFSPKEQLSMPLIEIPPHGKDVSLTLNLPE